MTLPKTLVVTVPGMIGEADLKPLKGLSEVVYTEKPSVTQIELAEMCKGSDYLMLNYDVVKKLDDGFYSHPNVQAIKAISVDITGMEWANPPLAKAHNVLLLNVPRYSTESVAESTLCEVLVHSRKIHEAYKDMIKGQEPQSRKGINLKGRTVGVVGLGSIGGRVAEMLNALGANVIAWNRTPRDQTGVTLVSLEKLFELSEVICICLKTVTSGPTPTVGFIGADLLARCRPGVIIVNLASRHLVDHEALFPLLRDGRISGYSVTRSQSTLALKIASLDSVSLPPANAWYSDESLQALRLIWVGNIVSAIQGKPQNIFVE